MAKLTMLRALIEKLDKPMQEALVSEITDLVKAKTKGLDFGISISDILKEVKPAEEKTAEEMAEEKKMNAFNNSLKEYAEGNSLKDFSIQEKI